ncbi:hypothetical protein RUM43_009628 [Polyplax serrata]|uniref:WH1 domain-containing protein n=1 Tax=Polyplax serrata TaxID=468196 RepID=A0AAN8PJG6_POLSC
MDIKKYHRLMAKNDVNKNRNERLLTSEDVDKSPTVKKEKVDHGFTETRECESFQGMLKRVSNIKLNDFSSLKTTGSEPETFRNSEGLSSRVTDEGSTSLAEEFSNVTPVGGESLNVTPGGPSLREIRASHRCEFRCGESQGNPPFQEEISRMSDHRLLERVVFKTTEMENNEVQTAPFSCVASVQDYCGPSFPQDVNDNVTCYGLPLCSDQQERITESEKHQLEMFFKSLKTQVFVCESLVNLYVAWKETPGTWTYRHTGVVVVILDCGDTKSKRKRKIQILLAERGTCFPLWKDTIDNLSSYHRSSTSSAFHVMHLSSDHSQIIGFSFDSPSEADKLLSHVEELTSNPENINISVPVSRKKVKKPTKKKCHIPLPHKKQISNPCLFQHVISVAAKDKPIYVSLQTLINADKVKNEENML